MKSRVMVLAWGIARRSASMFGGLAKEYMSGALKSAWHMMRDAEREAVTIPGGPVYGSHYDAASDTLVFAIKQGVEHKKVFGCDSSRQRRSKSGVMLTSYVVTTPKNRNFLIETKQHLYFYRVSDTGAFNFTAVQRETFSKVLNAFREKKLL